jgi:uncharacterized protein (TIGR00255 family)
MIKSMTGFGSAQVQCDEWTLRAEMRSVNHKDLQLSLRLPDAFHLKEFELQKIIEKKVHRGHVYLLLTCRPTSDESKMLVDTERLKGYLAALKTVADSEGLPVQIELGSLLRLPGALRDVTTDGELRDQLWPYVVEATAAAVDSLLEMRRAEGANLWRNLHEVCATVQGLVGQIECEQGEAVTSYRDRLKERVERLLAGTDVQIEEASLAREVAFYADRSDVSEEVARLRSHLEQFKEALDGGEEPVGRKMEFLGQEMLREASTMAAKIPAGVPVRRVLELKNEIEKLREQVRNAE